jgi:hypothetical protein
MAIRWIVKTTPEPPGPEWVSIFDNTYWKVQANALWFGDEWVDFGGEGMALTPANSTTWYQGFRPTKMRITGNIAFADRVALAWGNGAPDIIGEVNAPFSSPLEVDLDWSDGLDLQYLIMYIWTPVTNIEFLGGTLG